MFAQNGWKQVALWVDDKARLESIEPAAAAWGVETTKLVVSAASGNFWGASWQKDGLAALRWDRTRVLATQLTDDLERLAVCAYMKAKLHLVRFMPAT